MKHLIYVPYEILQLHLLWKETIDILEDYGWMTDNWCCHNLRSQCKLILLVPVNSSPVPQCPTPELAATWVAFWFHPTATGLSLFPLSVSLNAKWPSSRWFLEGQTCFGSESTEPVTTSSLSPTPHTLGPCTTLIGVAMYVVLWMCQGGSCGSVSRQWLVH